MQHKIAAQHSGDFGRWNAGPKMIKKTHDKLIDRC